MPYKILPITGDYAIPKILNWLQSIGWTEIDFSRQDAIYIKLPDNYKEQFIRIRQAYKSNDASLLTIEYGTTSWIRLGNRYIRQDYHTAVATIPNETLSLNSVYRGEGWGVEAATHYCGHIIVTKLFDSAGNHLGYLTIMDSPGMYWYGKLITPDGVFDSEMPLGLTCPIAEENKLAVTKAVVAGGIARNICMAFGRWGDRAEGTGVGIPPAFSIGTEKYILQTRYYIRVE